MIYPVKRRIWYKGQRFDTIDIKKYSVIYQKVIKLLRKGEL